MLRIASLQPSITLTLSALGCLDVLCAHTKYCVEVLPSLAELGLPVLRDSWSATTDELSAVKPDLVIASVPYRLESLAAILKSGLPVLALASHSLADVLRDTRLIAAQVGRCSEAESLITRFREEVASVRAATSDLQKPRVHCEEWGKPLIRSQGWVAGLIDTAGGAFVGTPGTQTTVDEVAAIDPDVLIFAWCGAGDRVPLERVIAQRGWQALSAVRNRRVYCIPDEYLNTPAISSLQQGLMHLASAVHPGVFSAPPRLVSIRR
jgi:iron complex transport system substrate-binding protein